MLNYSVLIPTCGRPCLLEKALRCLENQTLPPAEVIVIDQSKGDDTKVLFEKWDPIVSPRLTKKYIRLGVKSLVRARNAGIDAAGETDLIWFLDDDATVNAAFAQAILEVFKKDKDMRYAGGTGHIQGFRQKRNLFRRLFLMPYEGEGHFLASGQPTYPHWKKKFTETDFISGGCTIWRRSVIAEYRYDDRLMGYGYGEDVDVSYRVSRKYKNFYEPKALVFLHSPPLDKNLAKDSRRLFRRSWIQNCYYLSLKNGIALSAFYWFLLGLFLRDFFRLDWGSLLGDGEGLYKILSGRVDTVKGYREFKQQYLHQQ